MFRPYPLTSRSVKNKLIRFFRVIRFKLIFSIRKMSKKRAKRNFDSFPESFSRLKAVAFGILTVYGSAFQTFSNMSFIKNKLKSRLNNVSPDVCSKLRTGFE